MGKKQRSIYVYKTELWDESRNNLVWDTSSAKYLENVLNWTVSLSEYERIVRGDLDDPWTLWLDEVNKEANCIYGSFSSTSDGLHTTLLDYQTLKKAKNPKGLNQNEIKNTAFSIRLDDGMFLLGHYTGNIASARRVGNYFGRFSEKYNI